MSCMTHTGCTVQFTCIKRSIQYYVAHLGRVHVHAFHTQICMGHLYEDSTLHVSENRYIYTNNFKAFHFVFKKQGR